MTTINVGGIEMELTPERRRRIVEALIETHRHLDRELAYSEDLQKADRISFYRQHIAKLNAMLAN